MIVAAEVSDEASDARQPQPALDQLDENLDAIDAELPQAAALTADAGYFSQENIRITGEHGLDPYIATGRFKHIQSRRRQRPADRSRRMRQPSNVWRAS